MTNLSDLPLAAICEDHRDLVEEVDRLARICQRPASSCRCTECPTVVHEACEASLSETTAKMLQLMLEHFEREDELMLRLPRTRAAIQHCEAHRHAHVEFSARYNKLVSTWHHADVASCIRACRDFMRDWIHQHALRFDAELMSLASQAARA
ncbi:MAG: hemerythrin domain-containing protein [Rhodocyclaceae bacterium]|nr:hemerythrin domain-containing protein [Rhodocyclaceae bacterium]